MEDLYYALFRHKWKVALCSVLGFASAAIYYRLDTPPFQSEAKLFIRYVETERKTSLGPTNGFDTLTKSPDIRGETILNSEVEILTSVDLARQVAEAITPQSLLGRAGADPVQAAAVVKNNLVVQVQPRSSVIRISFRHQNPALVQPVLREVIDGYLKKHLEIHRAAGFVRDSLAQETDQLRSRLAQTEDELRQARTKAGVISIDDSRRIITEQMSGIQQQIFTTQADIAAHVSVLEELMKRSTASAGLSAPAVSETAVPLAVSERYAELSARLTRLMGIDQEYSTRFTPENPRVKEIRAQIAEVDSARRKLLDEYPLLGRATETSHPATTPAGVPLDLDAIAAQTAALQAKGKMLSAQLEQLRGEAVKVEQAESAIVELRRKRELEEANYRYYLATLEQSRINEALGNGRVSNISEIQSPSPPARDWSQAQNRLLGIALAGIGFGLAWAFLVELYLDRSLRRPVEVERFLGIPLLISIPHVRMNGRVPRFNRAALGRLLLPGRRVPALPSANGSRPPDPTVTGPDGSALAPFHETLRDRLIAYFESRNLTHKPKLVALAGLANHAGVTTISTGLARSLSETGSGTVLLVDMTAEHGSARYFLKGESVSGLDQLLETGEAAHVDDHLYVVVENSQSDRLSRNLPARFTKLVPRLKASDFDYILFDMPAVGEISITPRLARFMDIILLVVEAEKTSRDTVDRAAKLFTEAKVPVGVVLNKMHAYTPAFLSQEFLAG